MAARRSIAQRAFRGLVGEGWRFEPLGAVARVPALLAALTFGLLGPNVLLGVLAAGGAFTVGFGAPLDLRGSRALLLAAALTGIGASAVLGAVAGQHYATAALLVGVAGYVAGRAAPRGPGPAWITLQLALACVVATSFPAPLRSAAERALPIVAGGALQVIVLLGAKFARRHYPAPPETEPYVPHFAIHLGAALMAALVAARVLGLHNGYWAPMTALLVLRPGGRQTIARAMARVVGTIGGAGISSVLLLAAQPGRPSLALLVLAAAFGAYLFQKATYGLFSAWVTAYVVFLYALARPESEQSIAVARIVATALGGGIALLVQGAQWRIPRWSAP